MYFSIKIQIRLYFSVYCVVFFLPVPIRVCRSIAPQQPMKILEGMEWKSRDHVSPQECSADKAGLPLHYTNLEKVGAKLVSVHIPNYVLLYNLSAVIVWREKSSHLVVFFGGESDQYMRSAFLRSMFLSDISKIHMYISANFVGDISPLQRLACQ